MGTETPRNGVLAQYLTFIERMTNKNRTWLQQTIGAAAALVPLVVVVLLVTGIAIGHVHVVKVAAGIGAVVVCGGGIAVKKWVRQRKLQRAINASGPASGPEPGQNPVGDKSRAEGDEASGEDRHEVSGSAG